MSETKWTKGALVVRDHGTFATVYEERDDGFYIATFVGPTELTPALASAQLFAAASDLYAALDLLEQAFMSHTCWNGEPPAEIVAARAALAKARGESQ